MEPPVANTYDRPSCLSKEKYTNKQKQTKQKKHIKAYKPTNIQGIRNKVVFKAQLLAGF
jgi:hypothetical protein